jgi:hypothetical protein
MQALPSKNAKTAVNRFPDGTIGQGKERRYGLPAG